MTLLNPAAFADHLRATTENGCGSTYVHSNGHPGGVHDVAVLLELLSTHMLDPAMNRMELQSDGTIRFHGNFLRHSHVFDIRTSHPLLRHQLFSGFVANRDRPDYLADVAVRERAAREYHAGLDATGNREAFNEAKREWAATRPRVGGEFHGAQPSAELMATLANLQAAASAFTDQMVSTAKARRARP